MKKNNKLKNIFKMTYKAISYTIIIVLMIISSFLILCFINAKISYQNGEYPSYALYKIVSPSMEPNINVMDVVFVKKIEEEYLKVGDVITFYSPNPYFDNTPITHRINKIIKEENNILYETKGDANSIVDKENISYGCIIGKVLFKLPGLGKINDFLTSKKGIIIAILIPSLFIIAYDIYKIFRLIILRNKIIELDNNQKKEINMNEEIISNEEINKINDSSNLPVKLLSENIYELKEKELSNLEYTQNYMSHDYSNKDIILKYSGYPTDENNSKMNYIKLYTNKYDILGINVNTTSLEESDSILTKYNFKLTNVNENNYEYSYKNCKINIVINNDIVTSIEIKLISKYLGNRLY